MPEILRVAQDASYVSGSWLLGFLSMLMNEAPEFHPYGLPHLTVIFLTIVLPFALAAMTRRTRSQRLEKVIIGVLTCMLVLNYVVYLVFIRSRGVVDWPQMLPMQMCDW